MGAIPMIVEALNWVSVGVRAGLSATAAIQELKSRIDARGDAFDASDVQYFKDKAKTAAADAQRAIDAMP
jgi:hypothetical protein